MREYVHARVRAMPRLKAFGAAAATNQLAAASGGNFQFARSVLDLAAEQSWSPEQVRELLLPPSPTPSTSGGSCADAGRGGSQRNERNSHEGESAETPRPAAGLLDRLYVSLFAAQFEDRFREVQPVLELLLAARRHLTQEEVASALRSHFPHVRVEAALLELKPYLVSYTRPHASDAAQLSNAAQSGTASRHAATASDALLAGSQSRRVALQHLSFRRWLTDATTNQQFLCSLARGHVLMASHHLAAAHAVSLTLCFDAHLHATTAGDDPCTPRRDFSGGGSPLASQRELQLRVASSQRVFHVTEAAMHLGQMHARTTHDMTVADGDGGGDGGGVSNAGTVVNDHRAGHSCGDRHWYADVPPELSAALAELTSAPVLASSGPARLTAVHLATKRAHQPEYLLGLKLLLHAARRGGVLSAVLLARGRQHGKTALEYAAARGLASAVRVLLQAADEAIDAGTAARTEMERAADAALWAATSAGGGGLLCVQSLLQWGGASWLAPDASFDARVSLVMQRGLLLGSAAGSKSWGTSWSTCPLTNATGQTALFYAAKLELHAVAAVLLRTAPCTGYENFGLIEHGCAAASSPLYVAVSRGDADMLDLLLTYGASPALLGQHKRTDSWPRTPLGKASALGHTACVRTLLSTPAGAATLNLAPGAPPYRTALLEAVWALRLDCVELLLAHDSVDVLRAEADGACALHKAAYWGRGRASALQSEHELATALLRVLIRHHASRGLSVDPRDCDGCTPLCYACASLDDQSGWVRALIEAGASTAVCPAGGFNAHGWRAALDEQAAQRAERGHDALFGVAQPGSQPWGGTPIEEAASRGHRASVATLLAAANAKDAIGHSIQIDAYAESANELVAKALDAAAHDAHAPLSAGDLEAVGCLPAAISALLPEAIAMPATKLCAPGRQDSATPCFAERVHMDAPLPPAQLESDSSIALPPLSPARTPPAIGPAVATLCPTLLSL